ncbi:MAG: HemK2/MTQ2 family protein methyltransferase [Nanoarchaeota archaeon]|nr:HemK2/MTQ2 family protein methyltransferase [Nanoarchaeota archaeon]
MYYLPAEDSFFLAQIVKKYLKNKNITALDLGTGSGIQSENLISLGISKKNILAIDINSKALSQAKKLGVKTLKSNLFENIKSKFDLIIFNPPYLSKHKFDAKADTTGGEKGDEIIVNFIKDLEKHLTKTGTCFLLTSSFTPDNWKKTAENKNLIIKKIATKNLFFEKLFVWEIS